MSWSIYVAGSKPHCKRAVEEFKIQDSYPPEEKEQIAAAKTLLLLAIDGNHAKNAIRVEASGSMSVSGVGALSTTRTVESTNISIKVEPIHLSGMIPSELTEASK